MDRGNAVHLHGESSVTTHGVGVNLRVSSADGSIADSRRFCGRLEDLDDMLQSLEVGRDTDRNLVRICQYVAFYVLR